MSGSEAKKIVPSLTTKSIAVTEDLHYEVSALQKLLGINQKISECQRLYTLSKTIKKSLIDLFGTKANVQVYYHSRFFKIKNSDTYYPSKMNGDPDLYSQFLVGDGVYFFDVKSKKGNRCWAKITVDISENNINDLVLKNEKYVFQILPPIAATIDSLFRRADEKQKQYFENELNTARLLQQTLLPQGETIVINGVEVSGFYQSATECGGDWWGCYKISESQSLFFVGDVTGHGTASAMLCALVRGFCDSYTFRRDTDLSNFMKDLNNVVHKTSRYSQRIMTMAAILVDEDSEKITFCNAGHNSPVLINPLEQKPIRFLLGSGSTLGLNRGMSYKISETAFPSGSMLVIYSDGIVEAIDPDGDEYGERRMKRLIKKNLYAESSAELLSLIVKDMNKFRKGEPLADDVTIVVVKSFGY